MASGLRFAHLSDWHATTLEHGGRGLLRPKRLSGWASWKLGRRHRHDPAILEAAFEDIRRQAPDAILVTGDLTHVSLEQEFCDAARQLAALGDPRRVFLIPGNHDCYVDVQASRSWDYWASYLRGAEPAELDPALAEALADEATAVEFAAVDRAGDRSGAGAASSGGRAPRHADYPRLRIFGGVAVIALCSAIPTPIFRAGGRLGSTQLDRLERLLERTRTLGLFRLLMVHHPITVSSEPTRRALWDAGALREVLARQGAELVLHGHTHRRRVGGVPGPQGLIPVIGVPSSSEVGSRPGKIAQYHLYTVSARGVKESGPDFQIEAEIRGYDPASGAFGPIHESLLDAASKARRPSQA